MEYNEIPKFEPKQIALEGEKINLDDILNKEVAFIDIKVFPSNFYVGEYAAVQIMNEFGEKMFFRTSSAVLITQLTELKQTGKLPVRATIKKIKRYYTLA